MPRVRRLLNWREPSLRLLTDIDVCTALLFFPPLRTFDLMPPERLRGDGLIPLGLRERLRRANPLPLGLRKRLCGIHPSASKRLGIFNVKTIFFVCCNVILGPLRLCNWDTMPQNRWRHYMNTLLRTRAHRLSAP